MADANSTSRSAPSMNWLARPPRYAPIIPAIPNARPVRSSTLPARQCCPIATRLALPTTTSELAIAVLGASPNT